MSQPLIIDIDGRRVVAFTGDRLLDAALLGGIELPHKCRAGRCGTCVVKLLAGDLRGGEARVSGCFHACQTIVHSNLHLATLRPAPTPSPATAAHAVIAAIADLTQDVVEVTVAVAPVTPFAWLPGQYARITFGGFPARPFSPTVALDGSNHAGTFRLHIKRVDGGRVSSEIGRGIRPGHPVMLEGPFGVAAALPSGPEPLILFSSSTGFAPIWAIADRALRDNPQRRVVVVAAVDALENLYMAEALERMSACPNVLILPVTAKPQRYTPLIRAGTLTDFENLIGRGDHVHAAGPPAQIEALAIRARTIGAAFHPIAYEPAETAEDRWLGQIARQFAAPAAPPPAIAADGHSQAGHAMGRR